MTLYLSNKKAIECKKYKNNNNRAKTYLSQLTTKTKATEQKTLLSQLKAEINLIHEICRIKSVHEIDYEW